MLTAEQRAELKALADAATPGPWDSSVGLIRAIFGDYAAPIAELRAPYRHGVSIVKGEREQQANAKFIAAAREAIPAMLADLEEAEGKRANGNMILVPADKLAAMQAELAATRKQLAEVQAVSKELFQALGREDATITSMGYRTGQLTLQAMSRYSAQDTASLDAAIAEVVAPYKRELAVLRSLAATARDAWDNDQDTRVGKLLLAMIDEKFRASYLPDFDAALAAKEDKHG